LYGEVTLMELGSLLLLAIIAVVLLLQVIGLVQIAGMQKALRELKEIKASPVVPAPPRNDRFERKGGDFRRNEKRPYQDQRPPRPSSQNRAPVAPAPAAAPVVAADPVETSLRDINLRLKNAERDQDFARKKIQENLSGDRDQHQRGHDRSDRDRNDRGDREGGRDRNRGRDGNRDGNRDRNRSPRRDWQPQGNRPSSQQSAPAALSANSGDEQPTFERQPFVATPSVNAPSPATTPVEQNAPAIMAAPAAAFFSPAPQQAADQAPVDFSGPEDMEHGRKVLVKRRPLREEEGDGSENRTAANEETSANAPGSETEIQFGRRKGL
jgi:hypothetical protein